MGNDKYIQNCKPGDYIKVICGHEKEKSTAYYEVVGSKKKSGQYYLKPFNSPKFKSNGYNEQKVNAENLKFINLKNLGDMNKVKAKLYQEYKNKNPGNSVNWYQDNFSFDVKVITNQIKKELGDKDKNNKTNEKNNQNGKNTVISFIPEDVKENYLNSRNREITGKEYTENMFQMTKNLFGIPEAKRNLNDIESEAFKGLFGSYNRTDKSDTELRKSFDSYIAKNQNNEDLKIMGNLYKKTLNKDFKGFEIHLEPNVEYELSKTIEAIEKNQYPIMVPKDSVDYIFNPDTNALYRGNNQIALQRNNNLANLDAKAYVSMNSFIKNGGSLEKKFKTATEIINKGKNSDGNYVYEIVVPCKVALAAEKKALKEAAKEEKRRSIFDANYKYKYGQLPRFETQLQIIPEHQPPLINKGEIPLRNGQIDNNTSIEKRISNDTANFFTAMLTKEKYQPSTDWTSPEWKNQLKNFVAKNPEKFIKIANEEYQDIAAKVRNNQRNNENANIMVNTNTKSKSR